MRRAILALLLMGLALPSCGAGEAPAPPTERADRPAEPPPGWRTVRNVRAGFTVAAPRRYSAGMRKGATILRSPDRLVLVTVAADRSRAARELDPKSYARDVMAALPGFEGEVSASAGPLRGSPYRSAVVRGSGTVRRAARAQRVTVAALQRRGFVTYAAVCFRAARAPATREPEVARILATLRARPPS